MDLLQVPQQVELPIWTLWVGVLVNIFAVFGGIGLVGRFFRKQTQRAINESVGLTIINITHRVENLEKEIPDLERNLNSFIEMGSRRASELDQKILAIYAKIGGYNA